VYAVGGVIDPAAQALRPRHAPHERPEADPLYLAEQVEVVCLEDGLWHVTESYPAKVTANGQKKWAIAKVVMTHF